MDDHEMMVRVYTLRLWSLALELLILAGIVVLVVSKWLSHRWQAVQSEEYMNELRDLLGADNLAEWKTVLAGVRTAAESARSSKVDANVASGDAKAAKEAVVEKVDAGTAEVIERVDRVPGEVVSKLGNGNGSHAGAGPVSG